MHEGSLERFLRIFAQPLEKDEHPAFLTYDDYYILETYGT